MMIWIGCIRWGWRRVVAPMPMPVPVPVLVVGMPVPVPGMPVVVWWCRLVVGGRGGRR